MFRLVEDQERLRSGPHGDEQDVLRFAAGVKWNDGHVEHVTAPGTADEDVERIDPILYRNGSQRLMLYCVGGWSWCWSEAGTNPADRIHVAVVTGDSDILRDGDLAAVDRLLKVVGGPGIPLTDGTTWPHPCLWKKGTCATHGDAEHEFRYARDALYGEAVDA